MLINKAYYLLKPYLPWSVRIRMRRARAQSKRKSAADVWPIDIRAGAIPPAWPGWPEGRRFAFVLTHDVEGERGLSRIQRLMNLEQEQGFRSCFNLVPEGEYVVPDAVRSMLEERGFEVGVHGLEHDGKLYESKPSFAAKAARIRQYLHDWNAVGFRSPLMQHRLGWLHELGTVYDASTFDTDPFEPEPDGVRTIFPFWVSCGKHEDGYVELPYTVVQDFTLFIVLREKDNGIWKQKIDWIAERGGMVLMNTHPDYMCFEGPHGKDEFSVSLYEDVLQYVKEKYEGQFWHALPREVSRFYRETIPAPLRNSRKKICIVGYEKDAGRFMRNHAAVLAQRGDQVDVIALSEGDSPAKEEIDGVVVSRIRASARTHSLRKLQFRLRGAKLLTQRHHLNRYDVIHVFNSDHDLSPLAWYPRLTGTSVIVDDVRALRAAESTELAEYLTRIDGLSTEGFNRSDRFSFNRPYIGSSHAAELAAKTSTGIEG